MISIVLARLDGVWEKELLSVIDEEYNGGFKKVF